MHVMFDHIKDLMNIRRDGLWITWERIDPFARQTIGIDSVKHEEPDWGDASEQEERHRKDRFVPRQDNDEPGSSTDQVRGQAK